MGPGRLGALTSTPPSRLPGGAPGIPGCVASRPGARTRPGRGTARHGSGCSGSACRGSCAARGAGIRSARCRNRRSASCRIVREELYDRHGERGALYRTRHAVQRPPPPPAGIWSQARPSRILPSAVAVAPPYCLKKKGTRAIPHWSRSDLVQIEDRDGTQQRVRRDPANSCGRLQKDRDPLVDRRWLPRPRPRQEAMTDRCKIAKAKCAERTMAASALASSRRFLRP